jgi:hypothetical protein
MSGKGLPNEPNSGPTDGPAEGWMRGRHAQRRGASAATDGFRSVQRAIKNAQARPERAGEHTGAARPRPFPKTSENFPIRPKLATF